MRRIARSSLASLAVLTIGFVAPMAIAGEDDAQPTATEPDNTGVNVRDRDGATKTPLDQSNDPADVETTRKIRQGITDDDSLGMNARNVKVITTAGVVTLRGPVATANERTAIETIARSTPGVKQIHNEIEVDASARKE